VSPEPWVNGTAQLGKRIREISQRGGDNEPAPRKRKGGKIYRGERAPRRRLLRGRPQALCGGESVNQLGRAIRDRNPISYASEASAFVGRERRRTSGRGRQRKREERVRSRKKGGPEAQTLTQGRRERRPCGYLDHRTQLSNPPGERRRRRPKARAVREALQPKRSEDVKNRPSTTTSSPSEKGGESG